MRRKKIRKALYQLFFSLILSIVNLYAREENFILIDGRTGQVLNEFGPHVYEQVTPCSTFKIALSLMGYDSAILKNEESPLWPFQSSYVDYYESWRSSQTPQSWIKCSCVWYSQLLTNQLGMDKIQGYLKIFEYGNQDFSGGLKGAWLGSSLKISPKEQVLFLTKLINNDLSVTTHSIEMTKHLLFIDTFPDGRKLFGKTGFGSSDSEIGWFVGWMEKEEDTLIFAYNIRDKTIDLSQRIPRVKQLLADLTN